MAATRKVKEFFRATQTVPVWAILLVGFVLLAGGCGSASQSTQVKPGEPEYPKENPHPTRSIELTAIVPTTLSVRFVTVWSGLSCRRQVGLGGTFTVGLGLPFELAHSGESYRGDVVIDRFEPGSCGWQFGAIGFHTENPTGFGDLIASYDGRADDPESHELDIWCVKRPDKFPENPEMCGSLSFLAKGLRIIPPEFLGTVPEGERNNDGPVPLGPKTRSILVRFHDLDATPNFKRR